MPWLGVTRIGGQEAALSDTRSPVNGRVKNLVTSVCCPWCVQTLTPVGKPTLPPPSRIVSEHASNSSPMRRIPSWVAIQVPGLKQNLQARLQPAVPKERTALPGRKWLSGFFSIGSTQNPDDLP